MERSKVNKVTKFNCVFSYKIMYTNMFCHQHININNKIVSLAKMNSSITDIYKRRTNFFFKKMIVSSLFVERDLNRQIA